ncbi:hypothetical protein ABIE50_005926 [Chitinophaga sp. OAE865]
MFKEASLLKFFLTLRPKLTDYESTGIGESD